MPSAPQTRLQNGRFSPHRRTGAGARPSPSAVVVRCARDKALSLPVVGIADDVPGDDPVDRLGDHGGGRLPLGRDGSHLAAGCGRGGRGWGQEVHERRSPEVVGPVVGHDLDRGHEASATSRVLGRDRAPGNRSCEDGELCDLRVRAERAQDVDADRRQRHLRGGSPTVCSAGDDRLTLLLEQSDGERLSVHRGLRTVLEDDRAGAAARHVGEDHWALPTSATTAARAEDEEAASGRRRPLNEASRAARSSPGYTWSVVRRRALQLRGARGPRPWVGRPHPRSETPESRGRPRAGRGDAQVIDRRGASGTSAARTHPGA